MKKINEVSEPIIYDLYTDDSIAGRAIAVGNIEDFGDERNILLSPKYMKIILSILNKNRTQSLRDRIVNFAHYLSGKNIQTLEEYADILKEEFDRLEFDVDMKKCEDYFDMKDQPITVGKI